MPIVAILGGNLRRQPVGAEAVDKLSLGRPVVLQRVGLHIRPGCNVAFDEGSQRDTLAPVWPRGCRGGTSPTSTSFTLNG
jgi:hypothetical protein